MTRMAPAILLSSGSRGSQRKGSGLEGLHQVLLKLPRCFVERFSELICVFFLSPGAILYGEQPVSDN